MINFLSSKYSAYDAVIPAQGKALVKTDIQVELPEGCYGRVAPRSGLSWKNHIDVGGKIFSSCSVCLSLSLTVCVCMYAYIYIYIFQEYRVTCWLR